MINNIDVMIERNMKILYQGMYKKRNFIKFIQIMINIKIEVRIHWLKNDIYLFYHHNSRFLYVLII